MAILKNDDLSFDFRFTDFRPGGYFFYQFCFLWKDEPIINPNILKKWSEHFKEQKKNYFLAEDSDYEEFIPFLKRVLETNKAQSWEPIIYEDAIIAIYPDDFFPFNAPDIKHSYSVVFDEKIAKQREAREKLKVEKGNLPDDIFTIIIHANMHNFKDAKYYSTGDGISLHLVVTREDLEIFISELEKEYEEFRIKYDVDDWNPEGHCYYSEENN